MCVCVCVCVCVYLCVFVCVYSFIVKTSSVYNDVLDILEGTDQRSCVASIMLGASVKFLSSLYLKMSYFISKDENYSKHGSVKTMVLRKDVIY